MPGVPNFFSPNFTKLNTRDSMALEFPVLRFVTLKGKKKKKKRKKKKKTTTNKQTKKQQSSFMRHLIPFVITENEIFVLDEEVDSCEHSIILARLIFWNNCSQHYVMPNMLTAC